MVSILHSFLATIAEEKQFTLQEITDQLGDQHKLEIHLLDDLSSDGTAHAVYQDIKGSHIHRLSGKHFWGGSLNYIVDYCKNVLKPHHNHKNTAILIANDDLIFPDEGALEKGLNLLMTTNYDIIAPVLIDFKEDGYTIDSIQKGQYYDSKENHYRPCMKGEPNNVAVTAATWFSLDAICQAEPIPRGIPHYGSDFWLTRQLNENGVRIGIQPTTKSVDMQRQRDSPFQERRIGSIGKAAAIPKALTIFLTITFERSLTNKLI